MKERINWIDWAKALAICTVVFCHLPQSQEWFYYRYLQALTMIVFIFISGYLKKDHGTDKDNWKKYWHGLIIPYIIYNAIAYPYWLLKYYLENGVLPDLFTAARPLIGALLFEHNSNYAEPLNGPLWYLPAILIMHVTIDLCRKSKHQHRIMSMLCIISILLYGANKYWNFAPNLTPIGIMRNLPFYYMGYLFGQYRLYRECHFKWDLTGCIICLATSILLFAWHLDTFYAGRHILHIALFYPTNVLFLFGVLYGCKVLNNIQSAFITNLSTGTLVIIGLHIVIITMVNYVARHIFDIHGILYYQWYTALITAITICMTLYPVIIWCKNYAPIFLGRKR
jgi:fucose 4-O-acetylase-like acetyltransferase